MKSVIFGRKDEDTKKKANDLLKQIEQWRVKPNEHEMTSNQFAQAVKKHNFLKKLGSEQVYDFLNELEKNIKKAMNATPVNKNILLKVDEKLKAFNDLDKYYRDNEMYLEHTKALAAKSSQKVDPLEELYRRYENLTGSKCSAEITSKPLTKEELKKVDDELNKRLDNLKRPH